MVVAVSLGLTAAACETSQAPEPATDDLKPVVRSSAPTVPARATGAGVDARKPTRPARPGSIKAPANVAKPPAKAAKTKSGLASVVLTKGTGKEKPAPDDTVSVHYTGWSKNGNMFDSSVARGKPTQFKVNGVIKGWQEGLQLMVVGEKRRFWIPAALAYGTKPGFGPTGQLTFDVELLKITKAPAPPAVPKDLLKPPPGAKKTASGLVYRYLTKGKGARHPKATDRVRVHYSGWSKDGKMFDSSVTRGQPATFPLNRVIKGWTEGVQLMVQGDKVRFWIPADLAYGKKPKRPGAPSGDLVFDVELLDIL